MYADIVPTPSLKKKAQATLKFSLADTTGVLMVLMANLQKRPVSKMESTKSRTVFSVSTSRLM